MDGDADSGLMVNFTTVPKQKKANKPRQSLENLTVSKTTKSPVQFRKFGNKGPDSISTLQEEDRESAKLMRNVKHRKESQRPREKKQDSSGAHVKSTDSTGPPAHGIISSLFRTNPSIPKVDKPKVKQVKEKLFSSDDFNKADLHPYMVSNLEKLGFTKMTTVQQETIPKLMSGHDVMVKSQTGSGKTMAYAIPIIEDLARIEPKIKREDGIFAVVLVPTRELAVQSFEVFQKVGKPFVRVVPGCLMGGEKRKAEKARLRKGVNILIATPGRMIDHMQNTANMELHKVRWLVLDEADRLLDLGFEAQVSKIVSSIESSGRQTVLLSATLTEGVERLAGVSLKHPQRISITNNKVDNNKTNNKIVNKTTSDTDIKTEIEVKSESEIESEFQLMGGGRDSDIEVRGSKPMSDEIALPQSLKQYFVIVPCKQRLICLLNLILLKCKKTNKTKMIVFMSTQDSVEFMYRLVHYLSVDHQSSDVEDEEIKEPETSLNLYHLHGDMSQKDRTSTFQKFCVTKYGVLLCTDVAARGLHLPSVQWVVQYSCPAGSKDYVHRAGRTARAGTAGTSLMFLMPSEVKFVQHLANENISMTEMKIKALMVDMMKLLQTLPGVEDTERDLPNTDEEAATYLQFCCEDYIRKDKEMGLLAKKGRTLKEEIDEMKEVCGDDVPSYDFVKHWYTQFKCGPFRSCVRAYATYPSGLKYIFHVKHLHLGHMAKTFGLRDAPSNITGVPGLKQQKQPVKRKFHWNEDFSIEGNKPEKKQEISEFGGVPVYKPQIKKAKKMDKNKGKKTMKIGKKIWKRKNE